MDADLAGTVRRAWVGAVLALGGDAAVAAISADDLVARYGEAHRRYHSLAHVAAVIRDGELLAGELDIGPAARALLTLAAGAHDVVYEARPGDDERASAEWAGTALAAAGVPAAAVERVLALVLTTLTHEADPHDLPAVALLDTDLASLGADPDVYATYSAAVREEYAAVPDDLWRSGRSAVLADLAGRERLYISAPAHRRWNAAARRNLAGELAALRA